MSTLSEERKRALTNRLDELKGMEEWHLFQNFALGLLSNMGYTDVRHSVVHNDFGRDGIAVSPRGEPCFVAVSFTCSLPKIKKDARRWLHDPNREHAKVMVFVTWGKVTEGTLSKWRHRLRKECAFQVRIVHQKTILETAICEGIWRDTCSRLGIPSHKMGYLHVSPYNGELVRRGLRARPPEWLRQRVELREWAELSKTLRPRLILGKPGSGKTTTVFEQLQLATPPNVLVVEPDFREPRQLDGLLDDAAGGGVIVFDDIQENVDMFSNLLGGLIARKRAEPEVAKRYESASILAAARSQEWSSLKHKLPTTYLQDLGLLRDAELELKGMSEDQCAELIGICRDDWELNIEERLVKHAAKAAAKRDATPLYVISMLSSARAADDRKLKDEHLAGLPENVLGLWQRYWEGLTAMEKGVLRLVKLFTSAKTEPQPHLLTAAAKEFGIPQPDVTDGLERLERALWITRKAGVPTCLDVQLEAIHLDPTTYDLWDQFIDAFTGAHDTLRQLHNGAGSHYWGVRAPRADTADERRVALLAALGHFEAFGKLAKRADNERDQAAALGNASNCYADLATLEETRKRRAECLNNAVLHIEEAMGLLRGLGAQRNLAMSLNNASSCYSDLAELEETRAGRRERLDKAIVYIEEAIELCRGLGLHANLAMSLNNASRFYGQLATLEETCEGRRERLAKAIVYVEEAIELLRGLGLHADLATSLNNASAFYGDLAKLVETREAQRECLGKAVPHIEEAIKIRRGLGLQADLATSLNNAANRYSDLAMLEETREPKRARLEQGVKAVEESIALKRELGNPEHLAISLYTAARRYHDLADATVDPGQAKGLLARSLVDVEEAVGLFRDVGSIRYLVMGLEVNVAVQSGLALHTQELDVDKVLKLCEEGIKLAGPMGDEDALNFFQDVKRQLTTG